MTTPAGASCPIVLVIGGYEPFERAIVARLAEDGCEVVLVRELSINAVRRVVDPLSAVRGIIIFASKPSLGTDLLNISDAQIDKTLLDFLNLFEAIGLVLPKIVEGGCVVGIGSRGYLGSWGGAHEMALSGALVGLFRAIALENMTRNVRANLIALDFAENHEAAGAAEVADLATFTLTDGAAALNGELLLANHGQSLRMREARNELHYKVK